MTNTELLVKAIKESGKKNNFLAERLGLSYQGFLNKREGKTEFTQTEIQTLCELLNLTKADRERIFFAG